MTSAINPNDIDGTYPVAGQDNNSQGFRTNFTNIKNNFSYAAAEITDLQTNVLLKAALSGTTLNNDMGGSILSGGQLQDMVETKVALGAESGSQDINYAAGPYYTLSTVGSVSLNFVNLPAAGVLARWRVQITVTNPAHTLTLPAAVSLGTTGIQGYAANVITFGATGTYEFEFETSDGGSTITIFDRNRPLASGYTNQLQVGSTLALTSSEDLADAATINVAVTMSYFTTGGVETATLPSAAAGTIKILYARDVSAGNMVVTVPSGPAWGGAGTITFSSTGSACTLLSTGGGWVCIGNNGAVFA